jgi:hypothetical protein
MAKRLHLIPCDQLDALYVSIFARTSIVKYVQICRRIYYAIVRYYNMKCDIKFRLPIEWDVTLCTRSGADLFRALHVL